MFINKKNDKNFLEFVPVKSEKIEWQLNDKGLVQLIVWRNSLFDKIVRKLFNTPEKSVIDLDEQGSNVWENIDGEKNIYELSQLQKEKFGTKAEPVYNRIVTYINMLNNNSFITLKKK